LQENPLRILYGAIFEVNICVTTPTQTLEEVLVSLQSPAVWLAFLAAYLLGSIPTAVWIGKWFYGADVRNFGSGNAGATNTFRVLGRSAGIIVTLVDILKGTAAAALANLLLDNGSIDAVHLTIFQISLGLAAILGHIYPVFAGFRGGKGVATMVGMIFTIQFEIALICIGVFFLVLIFSKYVSLGSMIASLTFPFLLMLSDLDATAPTESTIILAFSFFVLVVLTHTKNIKRLLSGTESKSVIRLKKRSA
jgi:acyl phosphate:glycerol-3-phosphate acyltransferase